MKDMKKYLEVVVSWVHIMCVNVNNMYPSNVLSNMYLLLVSNIKHS